MARRNIISIFFSVAMVTWLLSCSHSQYEIIDAKGCLVAVDSTWDAKGSHAISEAIKVYKSQIESIMNQPVGQAASTLKCFQPESPLSNLTADILRDTASKFLGRPADMGVMNLGGLRSTLSEGVITVGNVYEIFPFENTVIVLTLKGEDVQHLFEEMALRGGEGISGAQLQITRDRKLQHCVVQGKPIDPEREYTIGTIDYLAEGNDGMPSFKKAIKRQDLPDGLLRDVFMNYVKEQTKQGKKIVGQCDGRIKVVK